MFKLPAYFIGFSSRADGSAGLRFETQEVSGEQFAEFKRHHNGFGWLIWSEKENEDIPDEAIEEEGISPSERLRKRMFVYFKEKKLEGDFNAWRTQQLEKIGANYLDKLN